MWLTEEHIAIGTKCNRLLCLNLRTSKVTEIPLPHKRVLRGGQQGILGDDAGSCGIHSVVLNPSQDLLATGGEDPADCQVFRVDRGSGAGQDPTFTPSQTLTVRVMLFRDYFASGEG